MTDKRYLLFGILGISLLFVTGSALALEVPDLPGKVETELALLPVQYNGRVKPFESFARETLDLLTGDPEWGKASPVETVIHMIAVPEKWDHEPILSLPYRPLRKELGLPPRSSYISYQGLFEASFMKRLPPIVQKQEAEEKLTLLENETMDLYGRFTTVHALFSGDLRLVPSSGSKDAIWLPLTRLSELGEKDRKEIQERWQEWISAYREGNGEKMVATLAAFREVVNSLYPSAMPRSWRLSLEVRYHKVDPLRWAWVLYGISFVLVALSLVRRFRGLFWTGLWIFGGALLFHVSGIVTRVILSGRPPVSNFYESMLWLPLVTALLGFLSEFKYRTGYFALSASLFGGITLLLSEHLPLDPAIQPIVAVLRSNKWLAIHVLTIVSSYGVLTLATGLSHIVAGAILFRKRQTLERLGDALYRVIQLGVILLAAGIMLGGVWANASWGRYWGWDPKETWALITLLWFLALLHGRKANWIGERGLSVGTIVGFFLLLMTYYGVSFYLVGLHSYAGGNAKPIPLLLIVYLVVELLFLCAVLSRMAPKRKIIS